MAISRNLILLKNKELDDSWTEILKRKKGAPRNEGKSTEVYENKRQEILDLGMSTELIENTWDGLIFYRSY
jgi:hypothetical protein